MGAESIVVVDPSVRASVVESDAWVAHQSDNLGVCAQMNDSSTLDFRAFLVTKRALDLVGWHRTWVKIALEFCSRSLTTLIG